jgi:hypothetical protein
MRYVSGSFYRQAKIIRKTLIPTFLFSDFVMNFYLRKITQMYFQKVISKKRRKKYFVVDVLLLRSLTKIAGSQSVSQRYGSLPNCRGSATLYLAKISDPRHFYKSTLQ